MAADEEPEETREPGKGLRFSGLLRIIVLAAGVCVLIASLKAASHVLAPLMGAMFVALIAAAPIPWLERHMPRWLAATLVGLVAIGSLVTLGLLTPRWIDALQTEIGNHQPTIDAGLDKLVELGLLQDEPGYGVPTEWMMAISRSAFRVASGALAAVVLTGFMFAELAGLRAKLDAARIGKDRLQVIRGASGRLATYFRIKTVASLITGIVAGTACAVAGLPVPGLWGLLAFILNYAPTVGSVMAAVPPVALLAITGGWNDALLLAAVYLGINGTIGGVIEPKALGERMGLSPLAVLFSLIFWGWVWGPLGLLLAVPMTMVATIIMDNTPELRPVAVLLSSAGSARRKLEAMEGSDAEAESDSSPADRDEEVQTPSEQVRCA